MSDPQYCYRCKEIVTFCECEQSITSEGDLIEELEAENEKLREQLDEQNEVIKDLDNALASLEETEDA